MATEQELARLRDPFAPEDIEWRVQQAGEKNGKPWARVLAYVTNRAIMDRLDEVVGASNWRNEYREGPGGGVLRLVGFDHGSATFCRRQTGGLRQAVALAGGERPRVRHVRCVLAGDAFCEWELRWA